MAQRRDHGCRRKPDAGRGRRHRREEDERARPRRCRILVARQRVLARVLHPPVRARARAEHDVLAHHHGVEPGVIRHDRHLHERTEVARVDERPVLAQDEDEPRALTSSPQIPDLQEQTRDRDNP